MSLTPKFPIGKVTANAEVFKLTKENEVFKAFVDNSLARYSQCDWGETDIISRKLRDDIVACFVKQNSDLVLYHYNNSIYKFNDEISIQIITSFLAQATQIALIKNKR